MNRTKIEAMLKEAKEKLEHYNTNKDEIYLRAKINVLTELLSNAEGEVKEVGIVELGDIANRAVQEVLNQGGKLTSEEQFALTQMFIELGEVFYSKLPSQPTSKLEAVLDQKPLPQIRNFNTSKGERV